MTSTLQVQNLQGPTSGANTNQVLLGSGQKIIATDQGSVVAPGMVLQVKSGSLTTQSVAISNSWYDLVTLNITPLSVNSKIFITGSIQIDTSSSNTTAFGNIRVMRGGTNIGYSSYLAESARLRWAYPYQFLDSPNSTTR